MRPSGNHITGRSWTIAHLLLLVGLAACSTSTPPLPQLAPDAVVLAYGDSLTYGTGAGGDQSYPAVLERLVRRRVINGGVPGELSGDGAKRLPALLDEHRPQLLILCHGGNDLLRKRDADNIETNLRTMIGLARERNIPVVLVGVPRPGLLLSVPDFYRKIAREFGLPLEAEVLPQIEGDRALKSDSIHPNADGYRLLAQRIYALMRSAGAV